MRLIGLGLAGLLIASVARAETTLQIAGTQADDNQLTVDWFLGGSASGRPKAAQLLAGNRVIEDAKALLPPDEKLPLCYLFLVDTSESMGKAIEKSVLPFLQAVVTARPERHYYGLARFDSSLQMLVEPTLDDARLGAALKDIKPQGKRTELYRSLIAGIKPLRACPGYRKVMVVLSDGGAEDIAYKPEDASAAAKEAHIAIVTIGYYDSIRLQNLAKLSEATGGGHLALPTLDKPLTYSDAKAIFLKTDTGGRIQLALDSAPAGQDLTLRVTAPDDTVLEQPVKVEWPRGAGSYAGFMARYLPWLPSSLVPWLGVLVVAAVIGLVFVLARSRQSKSASPAYVGGATPGTAATVAEARAPAPATVAGQRAPDMATVRAASATVGAGRAVAMIQHAAGALEITALPCTIGALRDNAVQINDESVSRYHAVLDRKDGHFYITDRGSSNGTFVNRSKTQHAEIRSGDQLQFGTWEGIFRVLE